MSLLLFVLLFDASFANQNFAWSILSHYIWNSKLILEFVKSEIFGWNLESCPKFDGIRNLVQDSWEIQGRVGPLATTIVQISYKIGSPRGSLILLSLVLLLFLDFRKFISLPNWDCNSVILWLAAIEQAIPSCSTCTLHSWTGRKHGYNIRFLVSYTTLLPVWTDSPF